MDTEGNGIGDVWIFADGPAGRGFTRSSSDGSYRLRLLPGLYNLQINVPPESELANLQRIERIELQADTSLDIVLERGVLLSGKVTDPEGKGLANIGISVGTTTWRALTTASSDGSYRFLLLPGTYDLQIEMPPGSEFASRRIEGLELQADTSLDIVLERGVLLSGKVTDPEGEGVGNVRVSVSRPGDLETPFWYPLEDVWTSSDGSYRLRLLPGVYNLRIEVPPENELASLQRIEGLELQADTSLDIVLERGVLLSGKVMDSQGKEIFPGDIIVVVPGSMGWEGGVHVTRTEVDKDGSYRLRLLPGTYDLLVNPLVGVRRKLVGVEVSADRSLDILLSPPEPVFTLSGTVTDKERHGLADLVMEAYDPDTGNYAGAVTQLDGTYSLQLSPGMYDLTLFPYPYSGLPKGEIKGIQITGNTVQHIVIDSERITAVGEEEIGLVPAAFSLSQNYPNPFNTSTIIEYTLPRWGKVHLSIYNMLGQRIRVLADGVQTAGSYKVLWDGKDETGRPASSGLYLYWLHTEAFIQGRKAVLVR